MDFCYLTCTSTLMFTGWLLGLLWGPSGYRKSRHRYWRRKVLLADYSSSSKDIYRPDANFKGARAINVIKYICMYFFSKIRFWVHEQLSSCCCSAAHPPFPLFLPSTDLITVCGYSNHLPCIHFTAKRV